MSDTLEREINFPSILKFTFPSILMMIVMSLYTVVDGIFVSRLVNTDAFSAVNIIYPLLSFTIGLGTMFGAGMTAIVSKKLGEGKREEANQNITFIIIFTSILGLAISLLCFLFLESIIFALGANTAVYAYCHAYALPLIFFFTANILQFQFQNLYIANGRPHIGLTITIIGGLTNVILDYVFIAKFNMGISGAAIATGIGYSIPAVFGLCYFTFNRKGNFCFVKPKTDWRILSQVATNGSSEMVSYLSTSVTTFLFNVIMMRLIGQNGVAAIAILLYLDFVLVAISLGYSMGVAPLISYNFGSNNILRLKKIYKISLILCAGIGIGMTAGTALFSSQLAMIFADNGTEVYQLAVTGLSIYAFGYLFKGFNIFSSALFTAFGNGKISAILSFMRTLVFLVISLIGLSTLFGVDGVWFASPFAEFMAFGIALFFVLKFKNKYNY